MTSLLMGRSMPRGQARRGAPTRSHAGVPTRAAKAAGVAPKGADRTPATGDEERAETGRLRRDLDRRGCAPILRGSPSCSRRESSMSQPAVAFDAAAFLQSLKFTAAELSTA